MATTKRTASKRAKATAPARPTGTGRTEGSGAADNGAAGRREQRRLLQQDVSRRQLLDAAEEVFGAKGFHETTLKEVAELAEFSVGSVYSFFENKDDLFLHVFLRRGEDFLPGLREAVRDEGTPVDQLHRLVDFEIGFFRRHPHFGRLYLRTASTLRPGPEEAAVSSALGANFDEAMGLHAGVFRRGQKAKRLRAGDPEVLARLLSGLVQAYQSLDPAVVGDAEAGERLPLTELHAIVEGAFVVG